MLLKCPVYLSDIRDEVTTIHTTNVAGHERGRAIWCPRCVWQELSSSARTNESIHSVPPQMDTRIIN